MRRLCARFFVMTDIFVRILHIVLILELPAGKTDQLVSYKNPLLDFEDDFDVNRVTAGTSDQTIYNFSLLLLKCSLNKGYSTV